jgi:acetylglutamate kinase
MIATLTSRMPSARVYKVGGPALEDPGLVAPLARELRASGEPALLVHGGGPHIERWLRALEIESQFVEGRRETSSAAMEVVEMVLSGSVNKALAAGLTAAGVPAIGLSGRDAALIRARLEAGLGRVGVPDRVDPAPIRALWASGYVPVVSPVSEGPDGAPVNVNADEAALGLAAALEARVLIYLSDVDGVKLDGTAVETLTAAEALRGVEDGTITAGMAHKVRIALQAARSGIPEVVIAGKARLLGTFPGTRVLAAKEASR